MVLRIDPRIPIVWRDPSSMQIGVDPAIATLDGITPIEEQLIAALSKGVSESGLRMIAGDRAADGLLAQLGSAVVPMNATGPVAVVAVVGDEPLRSAIADALAGAGVRVFAAADLTELGHRPHDLAVVAASHVVAPGLHAHWLRRDIPHLLVLATETAVTVGPFVEPGSGACLRCIELHHTDDDPAWPAIASQLIGRPIGTLDIVLRFDAIASATRTLLDRIGGIRGNGTAVRMDARGGRTSREWSRHPECGCGDDLERANPRFSRALPRTG